MCMHMYMCMCTCACACACAWSCHVRVHVHVHVHVCMLMLHMSMCMFFFSSLSHLSRGNARGVLKWLCASACAECCGASLVFGDRQRISATGNLVDARVGIYTTECTSHLPRPRRPHAHFDALHFQKTYHLPGRLERRRRIVLSHRSQPERHLDVLFLGP